MSAPAGQAMRLGGGVLAQVGRIAMAAVLLTALAVAGLAWRLAERPMEVPWLADRIAHAASGTQREVAIEHVEISWGGFSHPGELPLRLRLIGVTASGSFGDARLETADVALRLLPLLSGRVAPDVADLAGLRLRLAAAQGASGPSDPQAALHAATAPDQPWSSLRHLALHDASVEMQGAPGRIARLDIDLDRNAGGVAGHASALLQAAAQQATLTLTAQIAPGGRTELQANLTPISPASLVDVTPQAAALAALDAPVTLSGRASFGPALDLIRGALTIEAGAGTIHAGEGTSPLLGADIQAEVTPQALLVRLLRLDTAASPSARKTTFSGQAKAVPAGDGFGVTASLDVDQVAFADLPALWPKGVGGPGTRPWMTQNITDGVLSAGHVEMDLSLPKDFSDVTLGRIAGAIDGHDLTVHWLRPVPPMEHAEGRLTCTDPDVIDIAVRSGVQAGGSHGGVQYRDGLVHLTGIAGKDQFADIKTELAGSLADMLTVLNNPRIKLLSKKPLPMRDPAGDITAQVHVGHLPLRDDVSMDDLVIDTTAHTTHVHLGGIAAGYDLDDGTLDLSANNDGLTVDGNAAVAGFPTGLKIAMDFRLGPPDQVQQSLHAHSVIDMARLPKLGIATPGLGGAAVLDTALTGRRSGRTEIGLDADLARMSITEPTMGIAKAAGNPGSGTVRVVLQGDKLQSIDALRLEAPGISVRGQAEIVHGKPRGLRLDRLVLGTGTNMTGEIRTDPIAVRLRGPSLDLSAALSGSHRSSSGGGGMGGQAWSADIAADRVILGPGRTLPNVHANARSDGTILNQAAVTGGAGAQRFAAAIAPDAGGRRLTIDVPDAGALLRAADVTGALIGGRLHVAARWADKLADAPLSGVAELREFRIRDAPSIGRVLQALTVYGLADLARGPGLYFSRAEVPFSLERRVLGLRQARAFSASLGFTAQGRIDLRSRVADLSGTVVPAYFFNSLLGRLPLIGGLFSAERGGGLIAASVTIKGKLDDLQASVNPLSALTPGFLRGLFDDSAPTP